MIRVHISHLGEGLHDVHLEVSAEEADVSPEVFSDIDLEIRLDVRLHRVLVYFDVSAEATLVCDRTLRQFQQELAGSHTLLFASYSVAGAGGEEMDDVRELSPSDQEIDITDAVRDTLLLAIPIRKTAPHAEDEELPTQFGAPAGEESIDPRWEKLRDLQGGEEP